jgi:two-component system LytT family response regulator
MKGTVLIADDEPLARRTLREHLRDLGWEGRIFEAKDGATALALANEHRPDLVFLDIVMPAATGLEVIQRLEYEPTVIFTTAHNQYAVAAFELGALDYLMKPFGRERLERVVRRARATLKETAAGLFPRATESLQADRKLSRLFVRDGNRIVPIPLTCLERIQGADDYVTIYADGKEHLVSVRMSQLEGQLPSVTFLRIHRSHLINLEHVTSIEPHDAGRVAVVMRSGARIVASRDGTKRLRDLTL